MENNFSHASQQVMASARDEALRLNASEITPAHVFAGIIKTSSQTKEVLHHVGVDTDELFSKLFPNIPTGPKRDINLPLSNATETLLKIVYLEAKIVKQTTIEPWHLLLAILRETSNPVRGELEERGLVGEIREEVTRRVEEGEMKNEGGFWRRLFN